MNLKYLVMGVLKCEDNTLRILIHSFTFETLVSGFALRTSLIALSSFIFIARSTNWKGTFITGNKWLSIYGDFYLIPTDLANLPT